MQSCSFNVITAKNKRTTVVNSKFWMKLKWCLNLYVLHDLGLVWCIPLNKLVQFFFFLLRQYLCVYPFVWDQFVRINWLIELIYIYIHMQPMESSMTLVYQIDRKQTNKRNRFLQHMLSLSLNTHFISNNFPWHYRCKHPTIAAFYGQYQLLVLVNIYKPPGHKYPYAQRWIHRKLI